MTIASNLGFPRIGLRRELKSALEGYWGGNMTDAALLTEAARLRAVHWRQQQVLSDGHVPSGDFSLYDHVLDTACMLGAIPSGYGWTGGPVSLATYCALARGTRGGDTGPAASMQPDLPALEMTKWFDTNYHYLVPRLRVDQPFQLTDNRPLALFQEARELGTATRPVLLGPVSFLLLCKTLDSSDPLDRLDAVVPVYAQVLRELADAGCPWVQMDEPCLALDLSEKARSAFDRAYSGLARGPAPRIMLASYFGPMGDNLATTLRLPVAGLHVDLVRGGDDFDTILTSARAGQFLSLGLIDGRNVWRSDLRSALATAQCAASRRGGTERLMITPSCSLLHVPVDVTQEAKLDPQIKRWLAFAVQKLDEVATLVAALDQGEAAVQAKLEESDAALRSRQSSADVHRPAVADRLTAVTPAMERRPSSFPLRRAQQQARLQLPVFPTTTIGSFPQTGEVRKARAAFGRGEITSEAYTRTLQDWVRAAVQWQESLGIDVLVHGEFERNDMVKYFGEQLEGFAFTQHGWVQSYGSRCVAPPIIWGDVSRPAPMTVQWSAYAQSLTSRPMKGMLTGPVTMLQWSFVRDDLPREQVCRQIALAIRDEVNDLESAGIGIIQVDEPAFREGLPLRRAAWHDYLRWAVASFQLATAGVTDATAIHTHMCYSEFNDIIESIAAMDADAISIETTRSQMELLDAFAPGNGGSRHIYPAEIGPGVWDIHSPRVPAVAEMLGLLRLARQRLDDWQIWVNPDCGLKTRGWEEVRPALENLVAAARQLRQEVGTPAPSS